MDIIAEFNHYHNISFVCDDICVIEEKLITNEELDKLYDKIENDNAPRIIK
jgi:hypothetical protein